MTPDVNTDIVEALESSKQQLNAAAADLSQQGDASPEAGRWSALGCVEHVAMVEERFLGMLEKAEKLDAPRVDKAKESELLARVSSRATRVQAPEIVHPSGRHPDLAHALDHFNAVRSKTIRFAEEHDADLHHLSVDHPRFGVMNGAELLLVLAGHSRRHADQIVEVKETLTRA